MSVTGKGHIWAEYWIDCSKCDEAHPLAATRAPAKAAIEQGYRRNSAGPWVCPKCVEEFKEIQQVAASLATGEQP